MDYTKFITHLPEQFDYWGEDRLQPRSPEIRAAREKMQGMTTANVMQVLNFAVQCMEPGEVYCEIGCYQGATLVGALLNQPDRLAYAVDNFSEFDTEGENLARLTENLVTFGLEDQVYFCNQDMEEFLLELRQLESEERIGVYFYDGSHDYRSQIMGLALVTPRLADRALIVVDDSNWGTVRQGIWDFIAIYPACKLLATLPTPVARHPTFWNGLHLLSWDITQLEPLSWPTAQAQRQPDVLQAIYDLHQMEHRQDRMQEIWQSAIAHHQQQLYDRAEKLYQDLLLWQRDRAEVWLNLGVLYYETDRDQEALDALLKSLALDESPVQLHYTLGLVLTRLEQLQPAIRAFRRTISLNPLLGDAYSHLATLLLQTNQFAEAETTLDQGLAANPNHLGLYLTLGNFQFEAGQIEAAIATYERALTLSPDHPDTIHNLQMARQALADPLPVLQMAGDRAFEQDQFDRAIACYQKLLAVLSAKDEKPASALAIDPRLPQIYLNLATSYGRVGQVAAQISTLQAGAKACPHNGPLQFTLVTTLQQQGQIAAAEQAVAAACAALPKDIALQLLQKLMVPLVYTSPEEIEEYRDRVRHNLKTLSEEIPLETLEEQKRALAGTRAVTNFYLTYQARNLRPEQEAYGQFLHRVMAASYPEWAGGQAIHPDAYQLKLGEKLRVGYVSHYLHAYSGTLWLVGWLKHHDREQIEVYCYHTGQRWDDITSQLQADSHAFYQISDDLETVVERILADRLHILVYPEIGMHPPTMQIAALRLAPVQCTAWGHPLTSGLPTVDYYLSSELMEPENAQAHYSETLVTLPNLAIAYPKPTIPPVTKSRQDFGLNPDCTLFFCGQAPFKYLPQHDYLLAAIAQQVPKAQFVFLRADMLKPRLAKAFANLNLKLEDFAHFLPVLERNDYLILNQLADLYLDTIGFTGGNTTLDALVCGLPVVTLPSDLMRGRLSYAMLRRLDLWETIATNEANYIEIAVQLAQDESRRQSLRQAILNRCDRLFDDPTPVPALEAFYYRAIRAASDRQQVPLHP